VCVCVYVCVCAYCTLLHIAVRDHSCGGWSATQRKRQHLLSIYCKMYYFTTRAINILYFTSRCAAETVTFAINILYVTTCVIHVLYFTTHCAALPLIRRMASSAAATVTRTVKIWAVGTLRTLVSAPPAHTTKKMLSRWAAATFVSPLLLPKKKFEK
jgi:hypothetical protein